MNLFPKKPSDLSQVGWFYKGMMILIRILVQEGKNQSDTENQKCRRKKIISQIFPFIPDRVSVLTIRHASCRILFITAVKISGSLFRMPGKEGEITGQPRCTYQSSSKGKKTGNGKPIEEMKVERSA